MNLIKIFFALFFCFFYYPGYLFFYCELGKEDYSIPSMIFGLCWIIFALWGQFVLLFQSTWEKIQYNTKFVDFCYLIIFNFKLLIGIALLPLSIYLFYLNFSSKSDRFSKNDLVLYSGTLKEKPTYITHTKGSPDLFIVLKETPGIYFEPKYNSYIHYNSNFEKISKLGDTVTVGILKNEFYKYVKKSHKINFYEKHFENNQTLNIYHLEKNKKVYYSCKIHNGIDNNEKSFSFFLLFAALLSLFYSFYFQYFGFKTYLIAYKELKNER